MSDNNETTTTLPREAVETPWRESHQAVEPGLAEKAKDAIGIAQDKATSTASGIVENAKLKVQETADTAKTAYAEAREQIALKASETKKEVQSSFERHPLIYVAGALAAGVALGLAIPRSRKEKEAFNRAGQKLRNTAVQLKDNAADAAKSATEAAAQELEEELEGSSRG